MLFMVADLSTREREVMDLLCDGYAIKEVAHRLGMTERAARHLRDRAVAKYGVPNTTAAAVIHDRRRSRRRPKGDRGEPTLGLA